MNDQKLLKLSQKLASEYRVTDGKKFRLKDFDSADLGPLKDKDKDSAAEWLQRGTELMSELQDMLYAQDRWGVLIVIQAMDAAGKDSVIKHVMSGINPQGCQVTSFKQPSTEELDHDFLWRCQKNLPPRGHIGIFNRSYYEEVLVVRVHPEIIGHQKLPEKLVGKDIWKNRYKGIRHMENYLNDQGIIVRKFFLNVSREEQKKRFLARLDEPEKNWKFSAADVKERQHWNEYMAAYEDAISETATKESPWYIVPADHKWYTRLVVASAVIESLFSLKLAYPKVDRSTLADLQAARATLMSEKD